MTVTNAGGAEGTCNLVLKVNGEQEAAKDVIIAAGAVDSASFAVSRQEGGTYAVDVNGLESSFTVVASAPVTKPESPSPPTGETESPEPTETVATQPSESAPAPESPVPVPSAPPLPSAPVVNWVLIGAVLGGVVVLVLLIYLIVRRRRYS